MTRYTPKHPELTRRRFINMAVGTTATVGVVSLLSTLGGAHPVFRLTPDKFPPLEGDILVEADTGEPLKIAELGTSLVNAYPMGVDADGNQVIRSADPNNLLAVYKFPPGELGGETEMDATIDRQVIVLSDICTHAGCTVPDAPDGTGMLCPCHSGQYAPQRGGIVTGGPPPHKLAQLPVTADGDNIKVTGSFLTYPYPFTSQDVWEAYLETVKELV